MSVYKGTLSQPRYQHTDSIYRSMMLHGMAAYFCKANNGGQLQE